VGGEGRPRRGTFIYMQVITKKIGETPLEALERFRAEQVAAGQTDLKDVPMTYAGRLDPMAEGELLILIGGECKKKEEYLGLDKEYEVEIVFGIETDTYDALGLATIPQPTASLKDFPNPELFVGTFSQTYPPYSSRTVDGVPLHVMARAGELPEEMPTKEVTIYSIEELGRKTIRAAALKAAILHKIAQVKGDFRQAEIAQKWEEVLNHDTREFEVLKLRIACSSGTYMRSVAHRMGQERGNGAFALGIKRTKIYFKTPQADSL
jgi:tRNA pseudouridine55 synthase